MEVNGNVQAESDGQIGSNQAIVAGRRKDAEGKRGHSRQQEWQHNSRSGKENDWW